MDLHSTSWIHL